MNPKNDSWNFYITPICQTCLVVHHVTEFNPLIILFMLYSTSSHSASKLETHRRYCISDTNTTPQQPITFQYNCTRPYHGKSHVILSQSAVFFPWAIKFNIHLMTCVQGHFPPHSIPDPGRQMLSITTFSQPHSSTNRYKLASSFSIVN